MRKIIVESEQKNDPIIAKLVDTLRFSGIRYMMLSDIALSTKEKIYVTTFINPKG